jgi:hypothetical protein
LSGEEPARIGGHCAYLAPGGALQQRRGIGPTSGGTEGTGAERGPIAEAGIWAAGGEDCLEAAERRGGGCAAELGPARCARPASLKEGVERRPRCLIEGRRG